MRIRRRASSSFPLSPDPSYPSQNGSLGAQDSKAAEREKLHPVGDRRHYDLGAVRSNGGSTPCPNPCSDVLSRRRSDSSTSNTSVQRPLKEEEEQEEEEDELKRGKDEINSGKMMGGSSVAVDHGNGTEGGKVSDEGKAKGKAKARAGAGPASASHSCTIVDHEDTDKGPNLNGKKRPRRSPAILMEGSRCSRVNGRGWRCCQQTLVGYSLCEHHLGKGRLRSMSTSSRGQLGTSKPRWSNIDARNGTTLSRHQKEEELEEMTQTLQQCDDDPSDNIVTDSNGADKIKEEEGEVEMARNKRKKIGMVKARTISSLLDYSDHSILSHVQEVALLPPTNGIGNK
ncbi:uncharacterized protein LOC141813941 [Curcuma longa]|uniref:uncharacterized protein LOC141813941 n=1 Tax=Curcuma longa TaxID=136217 RepID=UPI003D9F8BCC